MEDNEEEPKFSKNKRLIEKGDGSHVGGKLGNRHIDPIDDVRLNKRGMSLYD